MKKYLLFIVIVLNNYHCFTQNNDSYSSDVDFFYRTLKEYHPSLYVRYSEHEFDSVFKSLKHDCSNKEINDAKFAYLLNKTNKYRDGHTYIGYFHNSELPRGNFPYIEFSENNIYIDKNQILSINGILVNEILEKLDNLVTWELNEPARHKEKNLKLKELLYYEYNLMPPYKCKILEDAHERDSIVNLIPNHVLYPKLNPNFSTNYNAETLASRFFDSDSIAILYYNSAEIEDILQFKDFLQNFFNNVEEKGIKNLFIDVSFNEGGSSIMNDYIFQYLSSESYSVETDAVFKKEGINKLLEYYSSISEYYKDTPAFSEFLNFINSLKNSDDKTFMEYKKENKGFDGQVFVIMGNETYSSGYNFCENIKWGKRGLLVGEESKQYSPFCGNIVPFELPYSKIEFYIPTTLFIISSAVSDGFLQPDIHYPLDHQLELADFKNIIDSQKMN